MEKLNWGWISYRITSTTLQDGSRYYIAKIKAEHDAYNFTMIELPFFTKNIRKTLRWICSEPRTREEILNFRNKIIIIKSTKKSIAEIEIR
jgi:hypothetical protein